MRRNPADSRQLEVWAQSLARTKSDQIRIITDLLIHANEDRMSEPDRVFARAALELLRGERPRRTRRAA
jgi:hypothetical protein